MAIAVPVDACSARVARARLAVRASSYSGVSVAPKLRVCPINPGVQHEHDDVGPNAVAIVVGCVPSGVTCPLQVHTRHRDHGSDDHAATAAVVSDFFAGDESGATLMPVRARRRVLAML